VPEGGNVASNTEEVNIFALEKQAEIQMAEGSNRQERTVRGRGEQ
jgi:hypothetical protein